MDSNLEEEIARLSRPPTANNKAAEDPAISSSSPSAGVTPGTPSVTIVQPQNGRLSGEIRGENNVLSRESSGSQQQQPLQRRGSGGLRSPQHRGGLAAAVLAGDAIRDVQMHTGTVGNQDQLHLHQHQHQQQQQYQQQQQQQQWQQQQRGGAGGLQTPAQATSSRPKLAANGEKMAGPSTMRPALTGEKMAGPSAYGRPASNGERVAGPATSQLASSNAEKISGIGLGAGGAVSGLRGGKMASAATAAASVAAVRKSGQSKDEEAWKKSETALKKKEQSVRSALREKQRTLQQESVLLATVDRELAQLALVHQSEVNELRKTLEVVDRELAILDRDAQKKLEAFEKARTALSLKVEEKHGITSRLTELILASEKQRDSKLNEIMKKMSADGRVGIDGGGLTRGTPR